MRKIILSFTALAFAAVISVGMICVAAAQSEAEYIRSLYTSPIYLNRHKEMFDALTVKIPKMNVIDVPFISQKPKFPNGCEAVSAVMALNYIGVDITPSDFITSYLDMGNHPHIKGGKWYACDPREQFPGDPRLSTGWGCYPEVIKKAIDSMDNSDVEVTVLKDTSLSTLCSEYIDNGIPVVFWGTIDMQQPKTWMTWTIENTDRTHTWISPFHCLLLVGYNRNGYYFNDPWRKKQTFYPKEAVETAYVGIGREALVVTKKTVNEDTSSVSGVNTVENPTEEAIATE